MRKYLILAAIMIALCAVSFFIGRQAGKKAATTADGWMNGDVFILNVGGDLYAWEV